MKRNASTVEKMYQAVKKLSTFHSLNQQAVVSLSLLVYNSEHDHQTVEPQLESPVFSCLFSNLGGVAESQRTQNSHEPLDFSIPSDVDQHERREPYASQEEKSLVYRCFYVTGTHFSRSCCITSLEMKEP